MKSNKALEEEEHLANDLREALSNWLRAVNQNDPANRLIYARGEAFAWALLYHYYSR